MAGFQPTDASATPPLLPCFPPQVMDYQMQQLRLLPLLATAYALNAAGARMYDFYARLQEAIARGDLSLLPEAHASTAGLKALSTSVMAVRGGGRWGEASARKDRRRGRQRWKEGKQECRKRGAE